MLTTVQGGCGSKLAQRTQGWLFSHLPLLTYQIVPSATQSRSPDQKHYGLSALLSHHPGAKRVLYTYNITSFVSCFIRQDTITAVASFRL